MKSVPTGIGFGSHLSYQSQLSLIDNVRLVTQERLMSMVCSVGSSGDCIEVDNGEVEDAMVASDR